jgi:hypothetical protein
MGLSPLFRSQDKAMIHDFDKTLEKMLIEHGKLSKNEVDISFELPNADWSSRLSRPTINCWCYDLRENVKLRNMEMNVNKRDRYAQLRLAPLRYSLTYLVTAWARRIEDEHQLLWRALGALARFTVLSPEQCEGTVREQPYDIPIMVGQVGETTGNIIDLWSVLESEMRLAFTVVVTLALDLERGFDAPLVFETRIGVGQSERPLDEEMTALDGYIVKKMSTKDLKKRQDEQDQQDKQD